MLMQVVFTAGKTWFSRLIQSVLDEPVSHVALISGGAVLHSNLLGVRLTTVEDFDKHATVIFRWCMPEDPQRVLDAAARKRRSLYDYGGLLFLGLAFLARKLLHIPLPKMNLWSATGMYLCTELVSEVVDGEADSMVTPYGLFKRLRDNQKKD